MLEKSSTEPGARELACGALAVYGDDGTREAPRVTIEREHGTYHVKRSPWHPDGHGWESFRRLSDARRTARRWAARIGGAS